MKFLIASDLHGSKKYCEMLLDRFSEEKADKIIFLGDVLYHGPRNDLPVEYAPKEVAPMLNRFADKLVCVRGNCDSEVDQMVLDFPILAEYGVLELDGVNVWITHGHKYNSDSPLPFAKGDILLHGHTHVPVNEDCGTFRYMNPGSLSIPKDGSEHSYMIYEKGVFKWKKLLTREVYMEYCINK